MDIVDRTMMQKRYGLLTIIGIAPKGNHTDRRYFCKCFCGNKGFSVLRYQLNTGHTRSCGCLRFVKGKNGTHYKTGTGAHTTWRAILDRCRRRKSSIWYKYGGKGITVCKRWYRFENFFKDMGERPKGMSIDRIDNNKGYSRSNCKWSTPLEQGENKSNTIKFSFNGVFGSIRRFSEMYKLPKWKVTQRIERGWDIQRTLLTP